MRRDRDVFIVIYQVRWLRPGLNITCNRAYEQEKAIELEVCALKAASDSVVVSFLMRLAPSLQSGENNRIRLLRQEDAGLSKTAKLVTTSISAYISYSIYLILCFQSIDSETLNLEAQQKIAKSVLHNINSSGFEIDRADKNDWLSTTKTEKLSAETNSDKTIISSNLLRLSFDWRYS